MYVCIYVYAHTHTHIHTYICPGQSIRGNASAAISACSWVGARHGARRAGTILGRAGPGQTNSIWKRAKTTSNNTLTPC